MGRNVNIVEDLNGKKIVVIHDIRFRGKRKIDWGEVEEYLKEYVGDFYEIANTNDIVYIGEELPDEYSSIRVPDIHILCAGQTPKQRQMRHKGFQKCWKLQ